jgi:redox-regulated HSP33 family molecular chaperone
MKSSIDSGLAKLLATRKANETFSAKQISEECNCSTERIEEIEKSALRKLRANLLRNGEFAAMCDECAITMAKKLEKKAHT